MKAKIIYCNAWKYEPQAARIADELIGGFKGIEVEFEIGNKGDFIVIINDEKIYSKNELIGCDNKRFPHANEISSLIKAYNLA